MVKNETNIVLFDGVCNLCNSTVQFIIRHDSKAKFRFASLQSEVGQLLISQLGLPVETLNTIIYITDNQFYTKSSAVLHIFRTMAGGWNILFGLMIIPPFLRDFAYDFIAKRRFRFFGRSESCVIPTQENQERFLG